MSTRLPVSAKEEIHALYPHVALALIGCAATGINRRYCEIDIAAFPAKGDTKILSPKSHIYRVIPFNDKKLLLLNDSKLVEDEDMSLSWLISEQNRQSVARARRARALELTNESIQFYTLSVSAMKSGIYDVATLYLLSSVVKLTEAKIFSNAEVSHPSHMAEWLRKREGYREVTELVDFDLPTSSNVRRRISKLSRIVSKEDLALFANKLEGMVHDGRVFDSLFYSYWIISSVLKKNVAVDSIPAKEMNLSLDADELKNKLVFLSILLKKQIISSSNRAR